MSSLITLGGILLLLVFGFWWAVKTGKRLNQAEALKERVDKVANVSEFNRREDEELNSQIQNAGSYLDLLRIEEIPLALIHSSIGWSLLRRRRISSYYIYKEKTMPDLLTCNTTKYGQPNNNVN
jgi:hypothetical protein